MGLYDRASKFFNEGFKPFDEAGPEIPVRPFGPGEVTAPAGIVKAITALAAARRASANKRAKDALALETQKKSALEIQALNQRIDAGTRRARTIGGQTIDMTDAEWAKHLEESVPKPEKPQPRMPLTPDLRKRYERYLGTLQPDPERPDVYTAEERDINNAEQAYGNDQTNARAAAARAAAAERAAANSQHLGSYQAAVTQKKALDLEVEQEGQAAYEKALAASAAQLAKAHGPEYEPSLLEKQAMIATAQDAKERAAFQAKMKRKPRYDSLNSAIDSAWIGMQDPATMFGEWQKELGGGVDN